MTMVSRTCSMRPARLVAGLLAATLILGSCGSDATRTESAASDPPGDSTATDATTDPTTDPSIDPANPTTAPDPSIDSEAPDASDPEAADPDDPATEPSAADDAPTESIPDPSIDSEAPDASDPEAADPDDTVSTSTTVTPLPPSAADFNLVEVCTAEPYNASGATVTGQAPPPAEPVVMLDRDGSHLCLGPVVLEGKVVVAATPAPSSSGGFGVEMVLTPDGIDRFNRSAALCSAEDPNLRYCPSSRLAIVSGTMVASAARVETPSFERKQVIADGDLTEAEARDLASAFFEDGFALRPVIVDLGR
jgi:hypothetical protein